VLFRSLGKVARLKFKDLELNFEKVQRQAMEIQTSSTHESTQDVAVYQNTESDSVYLSLEEQILSTVEKAPSAAILLAWSALEASLSSAVVRLAISPESPSYRSPMHNLEMLRNQGKLSPVQADLVNEMRVLRNRIAHEHKSMVSVSQKHARNYAETAIELVEFLNRLYRKGKVPVLPNGEWIETPHNFSSLSVKNANHWLYTEIDLPKTGLTAGVGPWRRNDAPQGQYECFGIDIEMSVAGARKPVAELTFSLDYVSDDALRKSARHLVEFDETNSIVTFDLGKSVFRYQLY